MQHSAYDSASAEGFYPSLKTVNIVDAKAVRRADPLPSRPSCARLRCAVQHCCTALQHCCTTVQRCCAGAARRPRPVTRAAPATAPLCRHVGQRRSRSRGPTACNLQRPTRSIQRAMCNVRRGTAPLATPDGRLGDSDTALQHVVPRCSMWCRVAACCGALQVLLRTPDGCIVSRTSRTCSHAARELNGDDAVAALELAQCGRFPVPLLTSPRATRRSRVPVIPVRVPAVPAKAVV